MGQDRGLGVVGELEVGLGALGHQSRKRNSEGAVDRVQRGTRCGKCGGEIGGHHTVVFDHQGPPLTRDLEAKLSKRRILELYLNVVELGPGVWGAEAAARRYFGVSAAALDADARPARQEAVR